MSLTFTFMKAAPEIDTFLRLRQQVEATFRQAHPAEDTAITAWKGQQIIAFQEHLVARVQGRLSEKWFYTYLRPERPGKLPRTDMLDLLSVYAGYRDWQHFATLHPPEGSSGATPRRPVWRWLVPLVMVIGTLGWWFGTQFAPTPTVGSYRICVEDAIRGTLIEPGPVEVIILYEDQSPVRVVDEDGGCLDLTLPTGEIRLVVSAPYYRPDTLTRRWQSHIPEERLALRSDDFARMIHYFSTGKVEDYEKRRQQLDRMFHDEARIFQEDPDTGTGVELYTKEEFIDKLTFPLASLQAIHVQEVAYEEELIVEMRFTQTENTP